MTQPSPNFRNIAYQSLLGVGALLGAVETAVFFNETLNHVVGHTNLSAFATTAAAIGSFTAAYVCLDRSAKSKSR
jgi:hypothetical protein